MAWRRWFRLGVPDVLFGLLLTLLLLCDRALLGDPGTFWHAQLGREIARTGDVPRLDHLTFTRDGTEWVDQSWAFDLVLARLVDHWGWSAALVEAAVILAFVYGAVARGLTRDGISPLVAVGVTVVAGMIGAIHFLARPHILTLALSWWTMCLCRRQHREGGWSIAIVPLLMVFWANVHGGFLAGPFIVATAALGHALSGPLDEARKRNLAKFGLILVLSIIAPLLNPYGFGLYRHVGDLLYFKGVGKLTIEFQPVQFGQPNAKVLEWVVLALIALPTFTSRRMDRYNVVQTLAWLHMALTSVRQAPVFALAMAPGLAQLLDGVSDDLRALWSTRMQWSIWPVIMSATAAAAVALGVHFHEFDPTAWPLDAVATLNRQPADAPLFHEQDWGGLIESECRPPRRAFIDDRCELFGRKAVLEYADALRGGPEWDAIRDRNHIEMVWVRPDCGLARRLEADAHWRVLFRDARSILFRTDPASAVERSATAALPLPASPQ